MKVRCPFVSATIMKTVVVAPDCRRVDWSCGCTSYWYSNSKREPQHNNEEQG